MQAAYRVKSSVVLIAACIDNIKPGCVFIILLKAFISVFPQLVPRNKQLYYIHKQLQYFLQKIII